ncbi:hypothetical protein PQU92_07705 [Asticcacaulis sp. BYS171W]|uniref:Uncharacterized protein n=1 Tax=Asticcacaulis aquaticus TaxID=2984212 RepID=A0ABT5HSW4_9CAUL|nr:hypothetical protein [Asticcacaulis aquaticus]MDC7683158.1 hypothetical protein [Asticcacaulis aquaticus]
MEWSKPTTKAGSRLTAIIFSLIGLCQVYPIFNSQKHELIAAFRAAAVEPAGPVFDSLVWTSVVAPWLFLAAALWLFVTAVSYYTDKAMPFGAHNARRIVFGGILLLFSSFASMGMPLIARFLTEGRLHLSVNYTEGLSTCFLALAIITFGFNGNALFQRHRRDKTILDGII